MSMICIGVVEMPDRRSYPDLESRISEIIQNHGFSARWAIDWKEPIVETFSNHPVIFSMVDGDEHDNCEMLLLPDHWVVNGKTNTVPARKRMQLFDDIAKYAISQYSKIDFYIGESGTLPDEYEQIQIDCLQLSAFLIDQLERLNTCLSLHITIVDSVT